jgi:ubiquinone/menaquinone biosynthesis C-methylase UbiE
MTEDEKQSYWGKWAASYDSDGEYVVGAPILQAIEARLLEEHLVGEVIEFGCGTGVFTKGLAVHAKQVLATDLSDDMLDVARSRLAQCRNVTVERCDCRQTSFPSDSFDGVFMANLVHVVADPSLCLRESYRILRQGGCLILVDFTGYAMKLCDRIKLAVRYVRKWGIPPRHTRNNMTPQELKSLAEKTGFRVESVDLLSGAANALYLRGGKPGRHAG